MTQFLSLRQTPKDFFEAARSIRLEHRQPPTVSGTTFQQHHK
jgi:hypothetical protein